MRFASPASALLFIAVFLLFMLGLYAGRVAKKRTSCFAGGNASLLLKGNSSVRFFGGLLYFMGLAFIVLALMQPQLGRGKKTVKVEGLDIFFAVDVSESMLAQDIKPDRFSRSKNEIAKFISKLSGDRIGLIAFSGSAFIQCPLTTDYAACSMMLDTLTPGIISDAGTDIGEAVAAAMQGFVKEEKKHKVLIIISDGEDHGEKTDDYVESAADEGIVIYTIGVGTKEGVPIPVSDSSGGISGYKKDKKGEVVVTRLDDSKLKTIAEDAAGYYYDYTGGVVELNDIISEINKLEKKKIEEKIFISYDEKFQWFLLPGFIFIVLGELLVYRVKYGKN